MRRALARAIVLLLVCDVVALAVRAVEGSSDPGSEVGPAGGTGATTVAPAPGPGATRPAEAGSDGAAGVGERGPAAQVAGTVTAIAADAGAAGALPVPLTLEAPRGEGRASIRQAIVDGERVTVEWDSGRPLPLTGDGAGIGVGEAHVEADAAGTTTSLDGRARRLLPGTYRAAAPVAVGGAGLARPSDGARFVADERTTITTRGGVTARTGPRPLRLAGPGRVSITGLLLVRTAAGLRSVTTVVFGPGSFDLQLRPRADGYEVSGTLRGPLDLG